MEKVCPGISAPWGWGPQALPAQGAPWASSRAQSWKKGPGVLAVTFPLIDSGGCGRGGCSRQGEEHMQMPSCVSECDVSQGWEAEHVGQDERLRRP